MVNRDSRAKASIPKPDVAHAGNLRQEDAAVSDAGLAKEDEISLLGLANVLLKRWRLAMGLPVGAALFTAVVMLIVPPRFTATASFVPETAGQGVDVPAGLGGLASRFGVSLPAGGNSPQFYADVMVSRAVRDGVLRASLSDPRTLSPRDSAPLLEILEIEGETEHIRMEEGRLTLAGLVAVSVNNQTNIVTLSVETKYPDLSAQVANQFLRMVDRFNLESRQTRAQQRRRFIEERLAAMEVELETAEESLKAFLERNVGFDRSPQLTFAYERLQRQVRIKEEIFTTLRRQYEEARIQEVNNTPMITVIDEAIPPVGKSGPKRKLNVMLAFVVGGGLAIFGAFALEAFEWGREQEEDYREFQSRWKDIRRQLRMLAGRGELNQTHES